MDKYEVGDVVRLKKQHPCGSSEWEDPARGRRFQIEMFRLRAPDHDRKKTCGEKYQRNPQEGSRARNAGDAKQKSLQTIRHLYDKIYLRDILLNSLLTHIRAGQRPKGGKFA